MIVHYTDDIGLTASDEQEVESILIALVSKAQAFIILEIKSINSQWPVTLVKFPCIK
jgi:hypothetical protein